MEVARPPINSRQSLRSSAPGEEVHGRYRHHFGGIDHVFYAHPFIGLMRQVEHTGTVGDTFLQAANPIDMLLVIGAG